MTVAKLRALLGRVYKKTAGSSPLDLFLLGQESQTEVARIDFYVVVFCNVPGAAGQ